MPGRARPFRIDHPILRSELRDPATRKALRVHLWRQMRQAGYLDESTIRYVRDPLDTPLAEHGLPDETTAVVRMSAMVAPRD